MILVCARAAMAHQANRGLAFYRARLKEHPSGIGKDHEELPTPVLRSSRTIHVAAQVFRPIPDRCASTFRPAASPTCAAFRLAFHAAAANRLRNGSPDPDHCDTNRAVSESISAGLPKAFVMEQIPQG